jgi:hypothetical protein
MRQIVLFAVLAALLLIGVGKLNVSTIREEPPVSAGIDTFGLMASAKDLPASHYDDYSLVFN